MFRRRRKAQEAADAAEAGGELDLAGEDAEGAERDPGGDTEEGADGPEVVRVPPSRPQGPWDVADAPRVAAGDVADDEDNEDDQDDMGAGGSDAVEDSDDESDGRSADDDGEAGSGEGAAARARRTHPGRDRGSDRRAAPKVLDLGGLRLPVVDGVEVRVEIGSDQQIAAATLVAGGNQLQVMAFAAPRSEGLWAEIRGEIADAVREDGGAADERDGPFGPELVAEIPVEVPGHGRARQAVRFIGVDAPRWFLRGLFSGPAATDAASAQALEDCFRQIVVVRGDEAMAPRDPLPLRLPPEAAGGLAGAAGSVPDDPAGSGALSFDPFERGPEITEVR